MIGTLLNAGAILAGGVAGLIVAKDLSPATQSRIKIGLGVFCVYIGLSTTWSALKSCRRMVIASYFSTSRGRRRSN